MKIEFDTIVLAVISLQWLDGKMVHAYRYFKDCFVLGLDIDTFFWKDDNLICTDENHKATSISTGIMYRLRCQLVKFQFGTEKVNNPTPDKTNRKLFLPNGKPASVLPFGKFSL